MRINREKLVALLNKMKTQFDFDVEIVADAIEKAAPAKDIVTKDQLAQLVATEIDAQMNEKAKAVADTKGFEDPHQSAGAIAVAIGNSNKGKDVSKVQIIKAAFLELMKNQDLIMLLQNDGLLKNKDIGMQMRY
ncbi:MAG: hypothetical protein E7184_03705 [Erysipelotrichaceae bacterium]|nr:hypothetical protein [Erysipelotrichaceae bacterium]